MGLQNVIGNPLVEISEDLGEWASDARGSLVKWHDIIGVGNRSLLGIATAAAAVLVI